MSRPIAIVIIAVISLLVLWAIGLGFYSIYKENQYPDCDRKVCHNICTEVGGFASRVLNATSRNQDGWVDCKCVGTIGSPYYKYIPIKLEDAAAGCK